MNDLTRYTLPLQASVLRFFIGLFLGLSSLLSPAQAPHSIAREWNEVLLEGIRNDFARPTVHARNLFHLSVAMYDAWAVYDSLADTYFLGKTHGTYRDSTDLSMFVRPSDAASILAAREEAITYAAFRIVTERFRFSPGFQETFLLALNLFQSKGYDVNEISTDYTTGSPARLGNHIASSLLAFGLVDGSREQFGYSNEYYRPVNPPMVIFAPGNPRMRFPNRWQPLTLELFIDQAGNLVPGNTPQFLSPEWGKVTPFALSEQNLDIFERDEEEWWVYHDPGLPPQLVPGNPQASELYKWGFSLVSTWSSHLDPKDSVMWDISPASIGNLPSLPQTFEEMLNFYNLTEGGDTSVGHELNPVTGEAYEPQMVPRGDYARILAEFWADGPDSETPPGHWFTIINYVNDHPLLEKRFEGKGEILSDLEWDVKAYLTLGGAMHDAAISAWGIKGYYDYIRPVSALRYMADMGQSSDSTLPNYHPDGIPLIEGFIELVSADDPLAVDSAQHIGKIKLYAWKGPNFIEDPHVDQAGVGWILAENWWPYQRPSFVTPPFAGYVSGHSTYSRAAAEVLTMLTGDPFFPGGIGEFPAEKDTFLVFEEGPSQDIILQWATYRDASDQCSLSRIWGGIHPPADDIPGRLIGEKIGIEAFKKGKELFEANLVSQSKDILYPIHTQVFPNPLSKQDALIVKHNSTSPQDLGIKMFNLQGKLVYQEAYARLTPSQEVTLLLTSLSRGIYWVEVSGKDWVEHHKIRVE